MQMNIADYVAGCLCMLLAACILSTCPTSIMALVCPRRSAVIDAIGSMLLDACDVTGCFSLSKKMSF
jgi:hypothetical protein